MGAGASAAHNSRLRKALVMRAYNSRPRDTTLEDQFAKYAFKKVRYAVCIDCAGMLQCIDCREVARLTD
jgi:hypothetical protein